MRECVLNKLLLVILKHTKQRTVDQVICTARDSGTEIFYLLLDFSGEFFVLS